MKDLKKIQEFFSKPLEENKELEGSMAAQKGKKYSENPYKKGTKDHLEWSKGHNASRASKLSVKEEKSFTDYDNKELAAYIKELSKQSQVRTFNNV